MSHEITRRRFLEQSGTSAVIGGAVLAGATAPRIVRAALGANDRIRIGLIGCGGRNLWLISNWLPQAAKQHNAQVVACCDIWRPQREHGVAVLMCDRAFVEGRKMTFDPKAREIRPA